MSNLRGGPADKAGILHEAPWGVMCMLEVAFGRATSIRIETPGEDSAEFSVLRNGVLEHWQAKRHILSQKNWTLQSLATNGVLGFFANCAKAGEQGVFASISDAPELRILAENARGAKDFTEFVGKFLGGDRKTHFKELATLLKKTEEETYAILLTVRTESAKESSLGIPLRLLIAVSFEGNPDAVFSLLCYFYIESVHRTLVASDIFEHLKNLGHPQRVVREVPGESELLVAITRDYLAGLAAKFIPGAELPRREASELTERIRHATTSIDAVILGAAGMGKSGCMLQLVRALREAGMPVLAFRLDRMPPANSTLMLGKELGFGDSPALVFARAHSGKPVAIVIDQLDYVSAASGRHPDFFDTVAALREEIIGLRFNGPIHVIVACRQFDFDNDPRLRCFLEKEEKPVVLGLLNLPDVKKVAHGAVGTSVQLTPQQWELLRLPQNLALYVDIVRAKETVSAFVSQTDLLGAYWDAKRRAMDRRRPEPESPALWQKVLTKVTALMSERQQLSVMDEDLEEFSSLYVDSLASEGVLSRQGRRYGFGHESLFDYSFARTFPKKSEIAAFLEADAQLLFRRNQLRQVLSYLRDTEFPSYVSNIEVILLSKKIRPHLQILTLELIAALPDPKPEELGLLEGLIKEELDAKKEEKPPANPLASRACENFMGSRTLFPLADKAGWLSTWLASDNDSIVGSALWYLRRHTENHGDRIAELLVPYRDLSDPWAARLRAFMEWGDVSASRALFDLFLYLLDRGTLDQAKDRFAANGTFWSMLHRLSMKRPAWYLEVAAHWLKRKCVLASPESPPTLRDSLSGHTLSEAAQREPCAFLRHVLPEIIAATKKFPRKDSVGPELPRDGVWTIRFYSPHVSLSDSYLNACEAAFVALAGIAPGELPPYAAMLRAEAFYSTNTLLLNLYAAAPAQFADEAMRLVMVEPQRLYSGVFGDDHNFATAMLAVCSAHCSLDVFQACEAFLLKFVPPDERSAEYEGYKRRGRAAYTLVAALDPARRSVSTNARLLEWQGKFGELKPPQPLVRAFEVVSPIRKEDAAKMSDEQWLGAMAQYPDDLQRYCGEDLSKGGASHLAGTLRGCVAEQPERFARLAAKYPAGTAAPYLWAVLTGLKQAKLRDELKIPLVETGLKSADASTISAALELAATLVADKIPESILDSIQVCALQDELSSDPARPPPQGLDIIRSRLSSVPATAIRTMSDLVAAHQPHLARYVAAIKQVLTKPAPTDRAVAMPVLGAWAHRDFDGALAFLASAIGEEDVLYLTMAAQNIIRAGSNKHFAMVRPHIERMLVSKIDEVRSMGGAEACIARLLHEEAEDLAETAITRDLATRRAAAFVGGENMGDLRYRKWCEAALIRLFHDKEPQVLEQAARCFGYLRAEKTVSLQDFDHLIQEFLKSPAFAEEPSPILHTLEESRLRLPTAVLDVCETFVTRCQDEAKDIRTALSAEQVTVGKLVFRTYAQLPAGALRDRALNLIDQLCLHGLDTATKQLAEFDR